MPLFKRQRQVPLVRGHAFNHNKLVIAGAGGGTGAYVCWRWAIEEARVERREVLRKEGEGRL